ALAASGAALVPTLINIDNFPGIAEAARAKFPVYAERMTRLHGTARARMRAAYEAGVPIYCGTDAGGYVRHGRVADEILALPAAGRDPAAGPQRLRRARDPLGAAGQVALPPPGRPRPGPFGPIDPGAGLHQEGPQSDLPQCRRADPGAGSGGMVPLDPAPGRV